MRKGLEPCTLQIMHGGEDQMIVDALRSALFELIDTEDLCRQGDKGALVFSIVQRNQE